MTTSDSSFPPISAMMARRLAHAIRTPLNVICPAFTEIGASPSAAADPTVAHYAELGGRSAGQLVELAKRLEWAGRVQDMAKESLTVIQWPDVIRRCVEVRCIERQERSRKSVEVSIAEAVGEGRARREASERTLAELLDNAVRHARTGVKITADVDGEQLRVRVIDDGPGLPSEPFAPPQQAGPRVGFGLWLVERLATAQQGSIGVERTGDEGTVMCLRLPLDARA